MRILWLIMALVLAWGSMLPTAARAAVIDRLTEVQGRVDILKGGKLPATPVQVGAPLEAGDVLRSKSLSKAQITLIDNSIITLSPQSRLAIDEFVFNAAQGKRQAVIELFWGLAHVVVNKLYKVQEPDFVVKTHTAVTGVRGTDFGVRLQANSTTILNFSGVTQVANIFPEVGRLDRKIYHAAFSFGPPGSPNSVILHNMQGTSVAQGLPPTLPFAITSQDLKVFMNQLGGPLLSRQQGSGAGTGSGSGSISQSNLGGPDSGLGTTLSSSASSTTTIPAIAPTGLTTGTGDAAVTLLNTVTVPLMVLPTVVTPPTPTPTPGPTPSTFNFTQQYYSAYLTLSDAPYNQSSLLAYSWGSRTGVSDGYFYATTEGTRTSPAGVSDFYPTVSTGTATATATGTVTGFLGQTLTGTMSLTGTTTSGSTITRAGTVSILPTGELVYNWTDTVTGGSTGTGTTTQTPGTYFTQSASGSATNTANLAGNQVTTTNSGDMTGTRVMAGVTSSFRSGFSVTMTSTDAGTFSSSGPYATSETSQGVLGPADANGVRTGVMTNTVTTPSGDHSSGGPVTLVPATSSNPEAMFSQRIRGVAGTNYTSLGLSAQTPDASAQITTQTYEGSGTMTSSSPYTTATYSGGGWGLVNGSTEKAYTATMGLTATRTTGGTFNPTDSDILRHTTAAVVLSDESGYHGPTQGIGVAGSGKNTVVSTTGTVTGNPLTRDATASFTGSWVAPDGKGTITAGTQTMTTGTYFTQTTNSGGQVTLSTPTSTPPYTQTGTLAANMTLTVGTETPVTQVVNSTSSVITSTTSNPANFPAPATVPSNINIQGVVNGANTGYTTITTHPTGGASKPVSTYMGQVTIGSGGSALTATNIVGRNHANPGVNRTSATQTGTVASTH